MSPGPSRLASPVCRCVQPVFKCLPSPGFQLAVWKRVGRGLFTKQQNLGIAYLVKLHMKKGKERERKKYRKTETKCRRMEHTHTHTHTHSGVLGRDGRGSSRKQTESRNNASRLKKYMCTFQTCMHRNGNASSVDNHVADKGITVDETICLAVSAAKGRLPHRAERGSGWRRKGQTEIPLGLVQY